MVIGNFKLQLSETIYILLHATHNCTIRTTATDVVSYVV